MKNRPIIYSAALLGLIGMFAGVTMLGRVLVILGASRVAPAAALAELILGAGALWLGLTVVGLMIWGGVWLATDRTDPSSAPPIPARKAYLYLGQGVTLAALVAQSALLIEGLLGRTQDTAWLAETVSLAVGMAVALLFWIFLRWIVIRDGDFGRELTAGADWRRGYFYLAALTGLVMLAIGATTVLRVFFEAFGGVSAAGRLAQPAALILVGAPLFWLARGGADRLAALAPAEEYHARIRKLFLCDGAAAAALVTLAGLTRLLSDLLTRFIPRATPPPANWPLALATLIVGGVIWIALEGAARRDLTQAAETPTAATIRQIARYGLAAVALTALLWGLTELLRIISGVVSGTILTDAAAYTQSRIRFAQASAMALVGAPAWWGFWWSQQSRTLTADPIALAERGAGPRRVYLYGIILGAAIAVFYSVGMLLFALITGGDLAAATAEWGPIGGVALLCLVGHSLTLRADDRVIIAESQPTYLLNNPGLAGRTPTPDAGGMRAAPALSRKYQPTRDESTSTATIVEDNPNQIAVTAPATSSAGPRSYRRETLPPIPAQSPIIVVIDGREGKLGAQILAALQTALPRAVLWPVGLNAAAQVAMLDALGGAPVAVPADACARATLILGSSDILAAGGLAGEVSADLAAAIFASPARKLLLPPTDPALRWVAVPDWSAARWIENAVIEAANFLA